MAKSKEVGDVVRMAGFTQGLAVQIVPPGKEHWINGTVFAIDANFPRVQILYQDADDKKQLVWLYADDELQIVDV